MGEDTKIKLTSASAMAGGVPAFGENYGSFYMPYGDLSGQLGYTPEKLIVPKEYHTVLRMCYEFYHRGGAVSTVLNRIAEFTVTEIRNGQRKTSDEANTYYSALLSNKPSRLHRFLRTAALEYLLSGMVIPRIDWIPLKGSDIHPDLKPNKTYVMPQFDLYPPLLVDIAWAGWGAKKFYIKIPSSDVRLIRNGGSKVKEQQKKYDSWINNYPTFVDQILSGSDKIELKDIDPILRKEISISPYPTPYLYPVLEPLVFKQQLVRMDFAVASRVINAVLLVQEGDKDFPIVEEQSDRLEALKQQIYARTGNPQLMERLFILFSNHTTKLTWITPDTSALLNRDKYLHVNDEISEGLGFTRVLLTGDSRQAQASEVSTYAVQPQMEDFRSMTLEWINDLYVKAGELNGFKNLPSPSWKPIRLQDFVKTAAIFAEAFREGNLSRTTRAESIGTNFETETELMKDEADLMKGLPAYQPTPYSPAPPIVGQQGGNGEAPTSNNGAGPGRPQGSQNVPVNNRNSGVKPPGQKPMSRIKAEEIALMADEDVVELINSIAEAAGLLITPDDIID
jgi:hypothetical protein